jgi:hypothetical protein
MCYEWQINNLRVAGWAKKLKEELEIIGSAYIWENRTEINANKTRKTIRERWNDIERQNVFSNTSEKISFIFYCKMKHKRGKESYTDECVRKE